MYMELWKLEIFFGSQKVPIESKSYGLALVRLCSTWQNAMPYGLSEVHNNTDLQSQ